MPEQIFYNTGISTYIWILTNRKKLKRRRKVQLIDASGIWTPMKKSLGDKRRMLTDEQIAQIKALYEAFAETDIVRIFSTTEFAYRRITIERPLRMNYALSTARIDTLDAHPDFKRGKRFAGERKSIIAALRANADHTTHRTSAPVIEQIKTAIEGIVPANALDANARIILSYLGERDPAGECVEADGKYRSDSELRDTETVPFNRDIQEFFDAVVRPHAPDAWVNEDVRDEKDGGIGRVGYEVNFNRYFYQFTPVRPVTSIQADLEALERRITEIVRSPTLTRGLDRSAHLKDSGTQWIGQIPSHWTTAPIHLVAALKSGHTPSRQVPEYWVNCTIPWVSLSDVHQFRDDQIIEINETSEKISELGLANSAAELLPAGTVILSRTASVGFSAILGRPMATTQDFVNWVCGPRLHNRYLLYCFRAMREEFRRLMMGSTHQTLYMPTVQQLVIPLPPVAEQIEIATHIERAGNLIAEIREQLDLAAERTAELRTALVFSSISGQKTGSALQAPLAARG